MAKQSQTLVGQWSNLMDNLKSLVGNTGTAINDKIKGFIAKINDWFAANKAQIIDTFNAIGSYAADILDTIGGLLGTLGEIFGSVMDALTMYTKDTTKNQAGVWK
jgi:predicted PurR-regulated permease PerM